MNHIYQDCCMSAQFFYLSVVFSPIASFLMQSLESDGLRDHLANFAEQLNKARQMIYPPDKKPSKLGALLPTLTEVVAKEHKRLLARKSIIEKRKEEQERQLLEMV